MPTVGLPQVYYLLPVVYASPEVVYERPIRIYRYGRRYWDRDRDGIPDRSDRSDRYNRYDDRKRHHGGFRDRDQDRVPTATTAMTTAATDADTWAH